MSAPIGNRYWEQREKHGRDTEYTVESIWDKFCEYTKWCAENPWYKNDFIRSGDMAGSIVKLETARPYTIQGFCVFAGISVKTFENYGKREDFIPIVTHIREIIYTQKFEGAAVGAFNASIIARDLGLTDKSETKFNADINHTITGMEVK